MNNIVGTVNDGRWKVAIRGRNGGLLADIREILSVWKSAGNTLQVKLVDGTHLSAGLTDAREMDSDFDAINGALHAYASQNASVQMSTITTPLGIPVQTVVFDIADLRLYALSEAGILLKVEETTIDVPCVNHAADQILKNIHMAISRLMEK